MYSNACLVFHANNTNFLANYILYLLHSKMFTGPGLPRGVTSKDLFHVTDWLPTLLSAAGQLTEQKAQIISN